MLSTYTVKGKILPLLPVQPIEIVREGTSIEPTPISNCCPVALIS